MDTILVVDDDAMVGEMMRSVLSQAGYRIIHAYTGQEAMAILRCVQVDCLVCDVMLPELNGDLVYHQMQGNPALAAIPVIIVSAVPATMYPDVRAAAWLDKPFTWRALLLAVRQALSAAP